MRETIAAKPRVRVPATFSRQAETAPAAQPHVEAFSVSYTHLTLPTTPYV